jgi:hypothetical protein
MKLHRTPAGLEAQLQITGIGRFISAAFLTVWLLMWAVGEGAVLCILAVGSWSLLTGQPPGAGRELLRPELALPVGLFLLFWLSFWTFGGVAAGRELLRLLFGRDRILAGIDALEIEHSCGLFRSRRSLRRDEIRRFYRRPSGKGVCVETTSGTIELTRLGNPVEQAELEQALITEFRLPPQSAPEGALPEGWAETTSLEHDPVLVKNPVTRRKQAMTTWIVCVLIASLNLYVISAALQWPGLWGLVLILAAIAGLIAWGAVWLSFGRNEWKLGKGRLTLQRRFGENRTTRFEGVSLELYEDSSGEDGTSYVLTAVAAGAPARTRSHSLGKHRRVIHSYSEDPTEPRKFGQWLSQRCQLPFSDLTSAEVKAKELEDLKQQLAGSGRLGHAALRIIERVAPPNRPPDTRP